MTSKMGFRETDCVVLRMTDAWDCMSWLCPVAGSGISDVELPGVTVTVFETQA
jgi:hypothetical protein